MSLSLLLVLRLVVVSLLLVLLELFLLLVLRLVVVSLLLVLLVLLELFLLLVLRLVVVSLLLVLPELFLLLVLRLVVVSLLFISELSSLSESEPPLEDVVCELEPFFEEVFFEDVFFEEFDELPEDDLLSLSLCEEAEESVLGSVSSLSM